MRARAAIMVDPEEPPRAAVACGLWLLVVVAFGFFIALLPWVKWLAALVPHPTCASLA